jgi:hypothetical protein
MSVTMPAKMISEMPLPMPRSVICSPSHMMKAVPVVSETIVSSRKAQPWIGDDLAELRVARLFPSSQRAMKNDWISDSTTQPVARVLVEAPPPHLPFLLDLLQLGDDDGQQLQMIDALMYGMMPSAKIDICSSAPPENMLNSPGTSRRLVHDLRHDRPVHARGRDERADADRPPAASA